MYAITIFSSLAKLGDDFGRYQYFAMYAFVPLLYLYCRFDKYESLRKSLLSLLYIIFPLTIVAGVAALSIAFMVSPPDFR